VLRYLRSIPVSIACAGLVLIAALAAGTVLSPASSRILSIWGAGVDTTLSQGHWWSVLTALIVPQNPAQFAIVIIATLTGLGWVEHRIGHQRTVLVVVVTGLAGIGVGLLAQWAGNAIGESWSADTQSDSTLDPLIPIVGSLLAASAFTGPLWRRRIRIAGFAFLLVFALYNGGSADAYRLFAATVGLFLGAALHRGRTGFNLHRSSHAETRTLLALAVAISAVGPVIAVLNPNGIGVLSMFGWIFGDPFPDAAALQEACVTESALACAHDNAFVQLRGMGSLLMLFLPLVLLLVAAYGLTRGRRLALGFAICVSLVLAGLAAVFAFPVLAYVLQTGSNGMRQIDAVELALWVGGPVLVPIALSVVLLFNHRHFRLTSAPGHRRRFWIGTSGAFLLLWTVTFLASAVTIAHFSPSVEPAQLILDSVLRFLPLNFHLTHDAVYSSDHPMARLIFQWVGPLFWAFFAFSLVRVLTSSGSVATRAGESEIRRLIKRGAGTLAFMAVWPGNQYWFSANRQSAVAYRVIGGVAITLSDPLCEPGTEREALADFIAHCDSNNWIVAFYSIHEKYLPLVEELGWESVPVAVETMMDLPTLEFTGKAWQNIRTPLNRGLKEGINAQWASYDTLSRTLQSQIRDISEQWVTEKDLPEMGFTLGSFEELRDTDVRLMLAVGSDGRIQAVTSWLPIYRDGVSIGWTLDFMRKAPRSIPGIMEFLIASAALRMKEHGNEILSLSGAPLVTPPRPGGQEPAPTVMTRVLDLLARKLEPAYGFTSLFTYKAKFNPRYETLSLAYRDPLTLPAIGRALGGAYLPDLSRTEALALVRSLLTA